MTTLKSVLSFAVLFALLAFTAFAEAPTYVTSSEVTLRGEVLYVSDGPPSVGLCAIMKDRNNEIQVYLAPRGYLEREGIELTMGKTITIVGSRTQWGGAEVILARQVTAGSKSVAVRDADGTPRW